LHLRQPAAAPAANLQQKLAERLYRAFARAVDNFARRRTARARPPMGR
jgi:hypothetical protein